jgi:serine/threonine protein kinase
MKQKIGQYTIGRTLGEGAYGKVKLAQTEQSEKPYAIKILSRQSLQRVDEKEMLLSEIKTMAEVFHPFVVNLFEVLSGSKEVYLVLEFLSGGELYDVVKSSGKLDEQRARTYFQQICQGVRFCHSRGVFHRDLKPENIFLDLERKTCKVGDFGLAAQKVNTDGSLRTICGTPNYAAPEVMAGSRRLKTEKAFEKEYTRAKQTGYDGKIADIWSCGCILYFMLTGDCPFHGANFIELQTQIQKVNPYYGPDLNKKAVKVLEIILVKEPKKRATWQQIFRKSWFKIDYKPAKIKRLGSSSRSVVDIRLESDVSSSVRERELNGGDSADEFSDFSNDDDENFNDDDEISEMTLSRESSGAVTSSGSPTLFPTRGIHKNQNSILQRQASLNPTFERGNNREAIRKINAFELMNLTAFDCTHMFDDYANVSNSTTRFISSSSESDIEKAVVVAAQKSGCEVKAVPNKPLRLRHSASAVQIVVEKYEVVPGIYMVNFNRLSGNRDAYYELFYEIKKKPMIKSLMVQGSSKEKNK